MNKVSLNSRKINPSNMRKLSNLNCKYFLCSSQICKKSLFLLLIICLAKKSLGDDSMIEKDHLAQYPYCGKMNIPSKPASARVVNFVAPEETYRWAVLVQNYNLFKDGKMYKGTCTGSVITDR